VFLLQTNIRDHFVYSHFSFWNQDNSSSGSDVHKITGSQIITGRSSTVLPLTDVFVLNIVWRLSLWLTLRLTTNFSWQSDSTSITNTRVFVRTPGQNQWLTTPQNPKS